MNGDIHFVNVDVWGRYDILIYMNEIATEQIRVFPSDYKELSSEAKKRHTSIAYIISEQRAALKQYDKKNPISPKYKSPKQPTSV